MPGRVHRAAVTSSRTAPGRPPTGLRARARAGRERARARRASGIRRSPRSGEHLGVAIGSLVNIFNPEMVVDRRRLRAGGGRAAARARARLAVAREALAPAGETSRLALAELGAEAGLIGAALVAFEALGARVDAARRLRDADREPRRRHAAGPRRAARRPTSSSREDTRHTRGLLERHGIEARLALLPRAQRGRARRRAGAAPAAGERMALVSDAGLPGVSDPGARLVRAALDAGVPVTVLPGPSAVETALVASGLVAERYAFVGFLPRRSGELAALWRRACSRGSGRSSRSSRRSGCRRRLRSLAEARPSGR